MPPHADTLTFAVPATAHHCTDGRALLLEAADQRGNGMLALLRYGDSLRPGPVPLIARGDSLTARGANGAVRYMKADVAYGISLDSGSVDVTAAGEAIAAHVRGSGVEGGVRVAVDAVLVELLVGDRQGLQARIATEERRRSVETVATRFRHDVDRR